MNRSEVGWTAKAFDNANNHSVVVKVTLGASSLLITGDLEEEGIAALLEAHAAALDADVYEVGHHRSDNGTTQELLDAITPKLIIGGQRSTSTRPIPALHELGSPSSMLWACFATGTRSYDQHDEQRVQPAGQEASAAPTVNTSC